MVDPTEQDLREEMLRRANALVERAGKLAGCDVDAAHVGNYVIEYIRGTWIYYYCDSYSGIPDVIYAQTVSGQVLTAGDKVGILSALNIFRAEMILDDLANA
jgi:hypothetical protein